MFEQFFDALASVLNFFYVLVPVGIRDWFGYGFSIMALTVLVMALITPLTVKSTRSMLQMQRMQPEMKRLQEKYKDDREKLNAELMAFYRENQINPLGGCLPMIAQMPVFIIMYQLIRGLTVRDGGLGSGTGQVLAQLQNGDPLTSWVFTDQVFHPTHLNPSTALYQALSNTSKMNFLGMDLSLSASQALKLGLLLSIPYLALLLVMLGTGLYQNRQLQSRNTSGNVNPQQQMIMKFMPFFLPIFSFGFPAGMALYWCTQNLCRIGTNAYITRSVYRKEHANDPIETTAKESSKGSGKGSKDSGKGGKAKETALASSKGGSGRSTKSGRAQKSDTTTKSETARQPGSSARSQAAHRKQSGEAPADGTTSGASGKSKVNPRRSGEARRGSQSKKS
ncbi:MAG: YidC/Oxa1 family membrane protein insertase [Microthrixaceae bacterium]